MNNTTARNLGAVKITADWESIDKLMQFIQENDTENEIDVIGFLFADVCHGELNANTTIIGVGKQAASFDLFKRTQHSHIALETEDGLPGIFIPIWMREFQNPFLELNITPEMLIEKEAPSDEEIFAEILPLFNLSQYFFHIKKETDKKDEACNMVSVTLQDKMSAVVVDYDQALTGFAGIQPMTPIKNKEVKLTKTDV